MRGWSAVWPAVAEVAVHACRRSEGPAGRRAPHWKLTTTGTDAEPGDNRATVWLRVLKPRIVAVPAIGKPGFVTSIWGNVLTVRPQLCD